MIGVWLCWNTAQRVVPGKKMSHDKLHQAAQPSASWPSQTPVPTASGSRSHSEAVLTGTSRPGVSAQPCRARCMRTVCSSTQPAPKTCLDLPSGTSGGLETCHPGPVAVRRPVTPKTGLDLPSEAHTLSRLPQPCRAQLGSRHPSETHACLVSSLDLTQQRSLTFSGSPHEPRSA